MLKPYRSMPIAESGESLVPIPRDVFVFFEPHVYVALGAPYNGASPWMLRKGVLEAVTRAQMRLQKKRPGWKIKFFDAYRPNAVQAFMVEREFAIQAELAGLDPVKGRDKVADKVWRLFGIPSKDPATPPLHSTGGAIDITLADENGREVDMGSPIDENSNRSNPDHFATAVNESERRSHANRMLLNEIMSSEGFHRNPTEWWHFDRGDQMWAWLERQKDPASQAIAIYGRADLLK